MPYCSNCGNYIDDDAKFCSECGFPVNKDGEFSTRKVEFAGKIIKCPSCGTEIPSFTAVCPGCGHEINSARVSPAIKEFTVQINEYDDIIASHPPLLKRGWKSWGLFSKIIWIVLNICTLCIPFFIHTVLPLYGVGSIYALSSVERKKAKFITNYAFPNDRENILEALLFIKTQMALLSSERIDRKTYGWVKVWKNKASQLYERANMMFKGDAIADSAYQDILSYEAIVKHSLNIKAIAATAITVPVAIALFFTIGPGRSALQARAELEWPTEGLALQIPEPESNKGVITNRLGILHIDVRNISKSQYEEYIESCKNAGFIEIVETLDNKYKAYDDEGHLLELKYNDAKSKMSISLQKVVTFEWPTEGLALHLPKPNVNRGNIKRNDNELRIEVEKIKESQYQEYIKSCKNAGFVDIVENNNMTYKAYNDEGYHLVLYYDDSPSKMTIILKKEKAFIWPEQGIALQVPRPTINRGEIEFNNDYEFWVEVKGLTETQYEEYIKECKQAGFTIEADKSTQSYEAFNEQGYQLKLSYYSSWPGMSIHVEAPKLMQEITWPRSEVAKQLPIPASSYGRIEWEADNGFLIYLGDTTKQDFIEYAAACYNAGFTVKFSRGDKYFYADSSEHYHVDIRYKGNNVMYILIKDKLENRDTNQKKVKDKKNDEQEDDVEPESQSEIKSEGGSAPTYDFFSDMGNAFNDGFEQGFNNSLSGEAKDFLNELNQ